MPELPEVETTRRGLAAHLTGATIADAVIRNHQLRWPIPKNLPQLLRGRAIRSLKRRAKYLLLDCGSGTLILHLGMSGSLRILPADTPPEKHDHFDLILAPLPVRAEPVEAHQSIPPSTSSGRTDFKQPSVESSGNHKLMRLRDPRRFGAVLWHVGEVRDHPLLARLGPEPLDEMGYVGASTAREQNVHSRAMLAPTRQERSDVQPSFDAHYLYQATRGRSVSIKQCIMDNHVVVGVGNIYANEALFRSGIKPQFAAGKLSLPRCTKLVDDIRATLAEAIQLGGSTLRDFVNTAGQPGYFQQTYWVYGRAGEPCRRCGTPIKQIKQGQRSSFYCSVCQK